MNDDLSMLTVAKKSDGSYHRWSLVERRRSKLQGGLSPRTPRTVWDDGRKRAKKVMAKGAETLRETEEFSLKHPPNFVDEGGRLEQNPR